MRKQYFRIFGIVIFILGIFLFAFIGLISTWGDIEASFFNSAIKPTEKLKTLQCPAVITSNEVGVISGTFTNTADKPLDLDIRTYVTKGYVTLVSEYLADLSLKPGETEKVEWFVTADDAAYGRLILARMHMMKKYPLPYRNAACGIVVINLPWISGAQFVIGIMTIAALSSGGGIALWALHSKPIILRRLKIFRAMIFLASFALSLAISGLSGMWGLSIILTAMFVFSGIGIIWQFIVLNPKKPTPQLSQAMN